MYFLMLQVRKNGCFFNLANLAVSHTHTCKRTRFAMLGECEIATKIRFEGLGLGPSWLIAWAADLPGKHRFNAG